MMTGITKEAHAFIDYVYVPLVLAAPTLASFEEEKTAAVLVRTMAVTVLGYSMITDMKGSAAKLIPYRTHAAIDFGSGLLSLAAPWLLGFSKNKRARNTLLAMGLAGLVVGALSLIGASKNEKPRKPVRHFQVSTSDDRC